MVVYIDMAFMPFSFTKYADWKAVITEHEAYNY
jgi:hypothetical protein